MQGVMAPEEESDAEFAAVNCFEEVLDKRKSARSESSEAQKEEGSNARVGKVEFAAVKPFADIREEKNWGSPSSGLLKEEGKNAKNYQIVCFSC